MKQCLDKKIWSMKVSNKQALLLTGGLHGMLSQAAGLADALGLTFEHHAVKLKRGWSKLPSQCVPAKAYVFNEALPSALPSVLISCGRHAAIASKLLKAKYKEDIFTIHIQNPIIQTKCFDSVIIPEHDQFNSDGVVTSLGAIHNLKYHAIEESMHDQHWPQSKRNQVAVILGGPTKSFNWTTKSMASAIDSLIRAAKINDYQLVFVPSNRTPEDTLNMINAKLTTPHQLVSNITRSVYLNALLASSHIVVTCDSASMLSEACFTGKPVYCLTFPPRREQERLANLHQSLYAKGMVRPWQGTFDSWSYAPLNEAKRIAQMLKEKYTNVFL